MPATASTATAPARPANSNFPFSSGGPVALDLHRFADENLNPDDCRLSSLFSLLLFITLLSSVVRRSLADANEEGIRAFHRSLVEAKQVVGGDLQRNVYRNYTEFVTISKEVSNLDGDVLALKGYLNELRSIWDGFMEEANPSESMASIGTYLYLYPYPHHRMDNRMSNIHAFFRQPQ